MQHRGKWSAKESQNKMKLLTYLLPSKTCKNTISVLLQHGLPTLIDNKSHLPHHTPVFIALPALLHNSLEEPRTEKERGDGGSASDLLPEGGDTVIEEPAAARQLLLLLLLLSLSNVLTFSPSLSLPLSLPLPTCLV